MLKGLYDAAAGMKARLAVQDIISSNLANAGTDGFQRQIVAIRTRRLPPQEGPANIQSLRTPFAEADLSLQTPKETLEPFSTSDTRGGGLTHTGSNGDVALDGPGYLMVRTAAGSRLVRGGQLQVNREGFLATANGDPLLSTSGRPIPVSGSAWQVASDGTVTSDGRVLGRLRIVRAGGAVRAEGATLASTASVQDIPAGAVRVRQGFIERSNVEPVKEMVDMIAGVRAYEASQRAVLAQDQSLQNLLEVARR